MKRGSRTDLAKVAELVKEKAPMRQVALEYPEQFIKYSGGIQKLHAMVNDVDRNFPPNVVIFIGDSGVGKTEYVRQHYPGAYYVPQKEGSTWFWAGYAYQDVVVFEEFAGANYCSYEMFKQLLSAAPFHVNMKNSNASFTSKTIVITSNYHPFEWYSRVDRQPLFRRLRESWCKVYFVSADVARIDDGVQALDRIDATTRDDLYLLPIVVLNEYLGLTPSSVDAESPMDYSALHKFDVKACKQSHNILPSLNPLPVPDFSVFPANQQELGSYSPGVVDLVTPPVSPVHKRQRVDQDEEKENSPCAFCRSLPCRCDIAMTQPLVFDFPSPPKLVRQNALTGQRR